MVPQAGHQQPGDPPSAAACQKMEEQAEGGATQGMGSLQLELEVFTSSSTLLLLFLVLLLPLLPLLQREASEHPPPATAYGARRRYLLQRIHTDKLDELFFFLIVVESLVGTCRVEELH